jgi:hypothetical protein
MFFPIRRYIAKKAIVVVGSVCSRHHYSETTPGKAAVLKLIVCSYETNIITCIMSISI